MHPGAAGGVGTWGLVGTEFPSYKTRNVEMDGADCTARPASYAPNVLEVGDFMSCVFSHNGNF